MRPKLNLRKSRSVHVGVGALILAIPASAVALTVNQANAQSAIQVNLNSHKLRYGHDVTVTGTAPTGDAGQAVGLEFAPAGSSSWSTLTSTRVGSNGRFRLAAPLRQSGLVRVAGVTTAGPARATPVPVGTGGSNIGSSSPEPVTVAAAFRLSDPSWGVLTGQPVNIHGWLVPGVGGRQVRLQGRSGGRWNTLTTARTGRWGGFHLRYTTGNTGQQRLRVKFGGDRANTGSTAPVGQLTVYRQSVASWYNDGGSTACGFHAYYGVANRTLPCGTKVTFRHGGHTVTATVDDRGPFVGGRDWDLNQNTASALGFGGVDTVWSSV